MPRRYTLEEFKLMVLEFDQFLDEEIASVFENLEITSEDDIHEVTQVLAAHRPRAAEMVADKYFGGRFSK